MKRNALSVLLRELAVHLRAAKYTPDALAERLGIRVPDDIGPLNHAAAIERLRDDTSAAATLTRLFFLEVDESPGHVLDAPTQDAMRAAGLLRTRHRRITPRLRLDPIGDQWLLSDLRFRSPDPRALGLPAGDPVYPPSSDSLLLRDAVVCPDANRVLDLCTGSGVQALSVAVHCRDVVAVDVSARAAAMTRANAALNCVTNIEVRVGDLYGPVAGERFDLVMANPPFVPSPYRRGPAYHSGGPTGARVLKRIVAGLAEVLQPAGRFFAVSHLALRDRETAADVVRPWFGNFPGRALALVLERGSAIDLAAAQALFALNAGLAAYAAEVHRWVAYLRRHRVREVILVLLVAERGGRRRAVEVIEALQRTLPLPLSHPPRHHIEQWLATLIRR
ncbi:MAG: methyltransferase [Deltaproteobacteria bacterium]|nr:methyltransferase [Deltaproteobacteria bacterium]MBI3388805.1 methyltransferase [Deltaproteobacteria bacterium]